MTVTVNWPDKLPLPTFEGYGLEPLDPIQRTEMESGTARQRRRFTKTPARIPARWRFTQWEFGIFESWVKWKAQEGAEWFGITLLGGLGMAAHEARFVGQGKSPYQASPRRGGPQEGVRWIVTSTLEVRERPILTADALEIVLVEDVVGLLTAIDFTHATVHSTLAANPW